MLSRSAYHVAHSGRAMISPALIPALCIGMSMGNGVASGQTPERILLVVNTNSSVSVAIGEYYVTRRHIPTKNVCRISAPLEEEIRRSDYDIKIAGPISACLRERGLVESVLCIVTTLGVPLRIYGTNGMGGDRASVDSELTALYGDLKTGRPHQLSGPLPNPFYGHRDKSFSHPEFPMYLVTRLAAYDLDGVKAMIDRSLVAKNQGKFVIDLSDNNDAQGNDWLRNAAILLPKNRVVFDDTTLSLSGEKDVIGYASWGSNDGNRDRRFLKFQWLPGAIATQYVSSDGRTFVRPPDKWKSRPQWDDPRDMFAGSAQGLSADYILEGATGASGHVYEPYLTFTPRPDLLLPAYYQGRTLAESYYLSMPALSWQNIVIGDPLCSLGKP